MANRPTTCVSHLGECLIRCRFKLRSDCHSGRDRHLVESNCEFTGKHPTAISISTFRLAVTAPVDEFTDEVVEEAQPDVAEDGERAMPDVAADAAVVIVDPIVDAAPAPGTLYGGVVLCVDLV